MNGLFAPRREAASLVDMLPYWGFVAPDVVLTRAGELLLAARVTPKAVDGVMPEDVDATCLTWQRFFAAVEPPHRAYVLFERRPLDRPVTPKQTATGPAAVIADLVQRKRSAFVYQTLSDLEVYVLLCYQPEMSSSVAQDFKTWVVEYLRSWLVRFQRVPPVPQYLRSVVDNAVRRSRTAWSALLPLLAEHTPAEAIKGGDFASLLHRHVNFRTGGWALGDRLPRYGLSVRLADSVLGFQRTHAQIDHQLIHLYSLALPPPAAASESAGRALCPAVGVQCGPRVAAALLRRGAAAGEGGSEALQQPAFLHALGHE